MKLYREEGVPMKQAVITGATGGIGHALAEGFAAAGYFVIATDLPKQRILLEKTSYTCP